MARVAMIKPLVTSQSRPGRAGEIYVEKRSVSEVMEELLSLWPKDKQFATLLDKVSSAGKRAIEVTGVEGSAKAFFFAGLAVHSSRPAMIVCPGSRQAESVYMDLLNFCPPDQVSLLPARDFYFGGEILAHSSETGQRRVGIMTGMQKKTNPIVVTDVRAVLSRTVPPAIWNEMKVTLQTNSLINREDLITSLANLGYERVPLVEQKKQFSARGELIDIYPPDQEYPFRLELFHDKIESIRSFDSETQRSKAYIFSLEVVPAHELTLLPDFSARGRELIRHNLNKAIANLKRRGEVETARQVKHNVEAHLEALSHPDGLEKQYSYFSYFFPKAASLINYMPQDTLLFIDEPAAVNEKIDLESKELSQYYNSISVQGELLPGSVDLTWSGDALLKGTSLQIINCSLFSAGKGSERSGYSFNLDLRNAPYYHGQLNMAAIELAEHTFGGSTVYLLSAEKRRASDLLGLLKGVFDDQSGDSAREEEIIQGLVQVETAAGRLMEGFIAPTLNLTVITEGNIMPRTVKKKRLSDSGQPRLKSYRELNSGDFIVHETHGIGKYQGLVTLEVGGTCRDYILLQYRGADKLYIPVEQTGLIQKYSGKEGKSPRLNSLGGGEWQRLKARAKRSVEELASELLSLYAARQAVEGYQYGSDHAWQQEFEANFPFEETPDQLKVINDVKADMEKPHPMDRLICGDVGYGKTEIALRAAFKAAMEGKQTAVLVPTTILARQHFLTFSERFADFPVKAAQLSRFLSPAEQKRIIAALSRGEIDVVIGTHRLLSKDVAFKDLGLLVIDEEHRFGVKHKERIRQLRLEVDTLAMTATPIPRTLHLSLAGARDMSIIDTPPENRYPVQTYVLEYAEGLVFEAIRRELDRGGQVFFVYNRVADIVKFSEKLDLLFPEAGIAVGHGRLAESSLEKVMIDFQAGKYDILVSTTIIEAGLDIPNVNTLIVYDADRFGLAQLYQLRGRVGRSERLAYAYLTYRRNKVLSEVSRKRLRAIKEFTELGSGFKIAMRDLEIRGAGNILGAEQHGFIAAIGFNLYCKMLERAVAEMKNQKAPPTRQPRFELNIDGFIPSSYVQSQDHKIDFYQRIYATGSVEEIVEIREELIDRYGAIPLPAENLLALAELRIAALQLMAESVRQLKDKLVIKFAADAFPLIPSHNRPGMPELFAPRVLGCEPPKLTLALPDNSNVLSVLKEVFSGLRAVSPVTEYAGLNGGKAQNL